MKTARVFLFLAAFLSAAPCGAFELASPDFTDGGQLPVSCSCDGAGIPPGLVWAHPPAGTKSFALTCIDPDAPRGDFIHWIVYDIPASAAALEPGGMLPPGSRDLANDYRRAGFGPACPPSGTHRYVFSLYALHVEKLSCGSRDAFFQAVKKAQIGSATLTGRYKRK